LAWPIPGAPARAWHGADTPSLDAPGASGSRRAIHRSLALESRLLGDRPSTQLRTYHDYTGALATLGEYDARFREAFCAARATLARPTRSWPWGIDGRALACSTRPEIEGTARAVEDARLRGELRANAGRYADAIVDFDHALSRRISRAHHERALYARASCRSRAGDLGGAKGDLEQYLKTFPEGPHAAEVRRGLDR